MKIGDLFVKLGVKADQASLDKFNKGVKSLQKNLLLVQAAAIGAALAIDKFADGTIKSVVALQNLNNQTGLSVNKLQKWQQAAQLSDLSVSAEQVSNTIGSLELKLKAIRLGQGNIAPFQLLGINAGEDAFGVLDQLRDRIKDLDPGIATNLLQQIGLTPNFINILKISREEFEKLSANTFLGAGQRRNVIAAGVAIANLKLRLKALKDQVVAKLAPLLTRITNDFFEYIRKNGSNIASSLAKVVGVFARFSLAIGRAVGVLLDFSQAAFGAIASSKALMGIAIALGIAFSPVLATMAALILLLEDFAVFKSGGDSVIGLLVENFAELGEKMKELVGNFQDLPTIIQVLGGSAAILFLGKLISKVGLLGTGVGKLGKLGFFAGAAAALNEGTKDKEGKAGFLGGVGSAALAGGAVGSVVPGIGTGAGVAVGATVGVVKEVLTRSKFQEALIESSKRREEIKRELAASGQLGERGLRFAEQQGITNNQNVEIIINGNVTEGHLTDIESIMTDANEQLLPSL